jgi:adenosylcobyric acid synthase
MPARTLMIQGTASSAGKSILVTALCRILKQDGYKVAPFKAQNMALNSFVTAEGGEIGRSQASQAEAAGIEPSVHMNPILLKPQADSTSQVVVLGKVRGVASAAEYYADSFKYLPTISDSLQALRERYDIVLIEGAGSPAEVNLMDREITNMRIATMAGAPVILVADIDRGGVFASIVGTMELLPVYQQNLIRGFLINKFRGDISLLRPGLDFLEARCNRPVLGVIPYMRSIGIAQEDSVYLDERNVGHRGGRPDICVIRLPHISNYDDFDPLEPACHVRYVSSAKEVGDPDLIILPGTKTTIADLDFLRKAGIADVIIHKSGAGTPVIGICGGYQMLGKRILDADGAESDVREAEGLGLLEIETTFKAQKTTSQVHARVTANVGLLEDLTGMTVSGYEIHMGTTETNAKNPVFSIVESNEHPNTRVDGDINAGGRVFGTYIHGLFNNYEFSRKLIDNMCRIRNLPPAQHARVSREEAYNDLACAVRASINIRKVYDIIAGGTHGKG